MTKNLLSFPQLCQANNVIIIFTSSYFQVKDPYTGINFYQGPPKDGVYIWSLSKRNLTSSLSFTVSSKFFFFFSFLKSSCLASFMFF